MAPLTRSHTVWGTTMQRCRAAIKTPLRGEGAKKGSLSAAFYGGDEDDKSETVLSSDNVRLLALSLILKQKSILSS